MSLCVSAPVCLDNLSLSGLSQFLEAQVIQVAAPVEPMPSRLGDVSDTPEGIWRSPERNLILDPIGSSDRTWQFTSATQNPLVR